MRIGAIGSNSKASLRVCGTGMTCRHGAAGAGGRTTADAWSTGILPMGNGVLGGIDRGATNLCAMGDRDLARGTYPYGPGLTRTMPAHLYTGRTSTETASTSSFIVVDIITDPSPHSRMRLTASSQCHHSEKGRLAIMGGRGSGTWGGHTPKPGARCSAWGLLRVHVHVGEPIASQLPTVVHGCTCSGFRCNFRVRSYH